MAVSSDIAPAELPRLRLPLLRVLWIAALAALAVLWWLGDKAVPWAFELPRQIVLGEGEAALEIPLRLPLAAWISALMDWLTGSATFGLFTFVDLTRAVSAAVEAPYDIVLSAISTGFVTGQGSEAVQILPAIPWIGVIGLVGLLGWRVGGWRLAALGAGCFVFIAVFGRWDSSMVTLASIAIAVPMALGAGLLLGLAGFYWRPVERVLTPILDMMQTIPVFAYLLPILILFGFNPVAAILATIIYALPPMTRITILALRGVPSEIRDLGRMVGCTRHQMTWRIMVPAAKPGLMVGVNQVIMLSLNVVIIASMIGAGGLGFEVLGALRALDFGAGLEAGLCIVALAIALDRLSQAYARVGRTHHDAEAARRPFLARHPYLVAAVLMVLGSGLAGLALAPVQHYPEGWQLSSGTFWSEVMEHINVTYFDRIEAVKNFFILNVLKPARIFLLDLPWIGVTALLALAGWSLGGWRLALLVTGLALFVVVTGQWEKAMITVYLCGISVVVAMLIGVPVGILAAERGWLRGVVQAGIDTLQTLPSFVYLMPAVMLFRVGDFTAMLAVVAFAVAPAIRYTIHGLRQVDPQLVEAGRVAGCTEWQLLTKIKLRLALPEIMLGLNQTIMLALSMLVITALVGTRDLGQEVYAALAKADAGRGMVAGLCIAAIAIIADRLITAGAARMRARLGLGAAGAA